jgi:hypothetical protein
MTSEIGAPPSSASGLPAPFPLPTPPSLPTLPLPRPPPPPRIVLTGGGSVSIGNGQSVSVQFQVVTTDIFEPISLAALGLPQGVTAAFSPPSLPAPDAGAVQRFSLTLTAVPNAPAAQSTIQLTAAASGLTPALAWVTVAVVSPFSFVPGAPILPIAASGESTVSRATPVLLAAYGHATIPLNLQIAEGVTGTISFAAAAAFPAGVTAQFNPLTLNAPPEAGDVAVTLLLTAGADIIPGTYSVSVDVTAGTATSGVFTFPLQLAAPFVSDVSPSAFSVPMFGQTGTSVVITGGGFGPGTTVAFGADPPVTASSVASDGTSLMVTVPPTAASGSVSVVSPAGSASGLRPVLAGHVPPTISPTAAGIITLPLAGAGFAVDNYRNTRGFSWINNTTFQALVGGSYSEGDATALFGASQTTYNFQIRGIGPKGFDPLVDIFLKVADSLLDSGGQCFGMSLASLRFAAGQMSFTGLPQQPAGAEPAGPPGPDAWLLNGPQLGPQSGDATNVSPSLATYVHRQHLAQLSQEYINNWTRFRENVSSAAGLQNAIQQAFTAGGVDGRGAIICINPSNSDGHAVVAYDIVDTGGGAFNILVYDPNVPFLPGEDSDPVQRASQAAESVINVMSDGSWVLPNSALIFNQTGIADWSGDIDHITVIPWNTIPPTPSLPWAEILAASGLSLAFLWIVTGDASVSQVSDGQGHLLLAGGQWNLDPDTVLSGVRPLPAFGGLGQSSVPAFASTSPAPLIQTITGNAAGTYDLQWVGGGYGVTMTAVPTTPGTSDTVLMRSGGVDFTAAQDKTVAMTVTGIGTASGLPRTATVQTGASAGAAVSVLFNPATETFSYVNHGAPASYTVELSSIDATGHASSLTAPAASAQTGDTLTFSPDWTQLGAGRGILSAQTAAGAVTNIPL